MAETAGRCVAIGDLEIANSRPFAAILGPCQIESRDHALFMAESLAKAAGAAGVPFIFKSSFDKANRSSLSGKRGVGLEEGLRILCDVRDALGCPVLTDVHEREQCAPAAEAVDVLQIPAFLCRQTDLLLAAAATGKAVNVKKGQFLAPWDMKNVADKLAAGGNHRILLTERGASFGYNTLVTDFRSLPTMAQTGYPVIYDATHSVQQPGALGEASGGQRGFAPILARAAVAVGVAGLFMEAHEDPDKAPSDGAVMLKLEWVAPLLKELAALDRLAKDPVRLQTLAAAVAAKQPVAVV
ncbi:MAG: 3-deoxy-8-phosphooctulonate synthase [Rhodospirillales bacterium]|nr:3-deoxy-8-phosphooctulonate synthase [Rhodospirillales bacterium]